jgi:hypothetical protein
MGSGVLGKFKLYGPEMILDVLEERIVLDASVAASCQDNPDNPDNPDNSDDSSSQADNGSGDSGATESNTGSDGSSDSLETVFDQDLNVVLISNAIDQIESVTDAVEEGAQVIVYDADNDDLSAVTDSLRELVDTTGQEIGHLAIVSHGDAGFLVLSQLQVFNAEMVESTSEAWHELGTLLSDNARIDLYGCDIGQGEDGAQLVNALADATDATVWASDDTTGDAYGGDWELEVQSDASSLPYLIDGSALVGVPIKLENELLTNAGFEFADTRGWDVIRGPVYVIEADSSNYGGIAVPISPYAVTSNYLLQIDNNSGTDYDNQYAEISQDFWVTSADSVKFAYNFVTDRDYSGYDSFGWEITVVGSGTVIDRISPYPFDAGDIPPYPGNTVGLPRSTGWHEVEVDLSAYVGQQVSIRLWSGNTSDTQYPSWGFFDFDTSTINDPSVIKVPGDQTTNEDTSVAISGVSVVDVDSGANDVTLTLTVTNGTLDINDSVAGGLSTGDITGNGTDTVILTGSQAEINATLADAMGITYDPILNYNGTDTLTLVTTDNGSTGIGGPQVFTNTIDIVVDPVNDPAAITVPGPQTVSEDIPYVISGVSIDDPDAGSADITVTLTVGNGTLQVSSSAPGGLAPGDIVGNGTGTVTLTGTQTEINNTFADAAGITYTSTLNYFGPDTLTLESNDGGASGSGGAQIDNEAIDITVNPVDDPPLITVPGPQTTAEETPLPIAGVSLNDPDGGSATVTFTITSVNGTVLISDSVPGGLTAGDISGNGTGTVVLTGTEAEINATLADLNGMTYTPVLNYSGPDTITVESSIGGVVGDTDVINVNVTPVNDAPNANPIPDPDAVFEDFGTVTYDTHWSFSDIDGDSLTYEIKPLDYSALLSDMTIDPNTGIITFDSLANAHGSIDLEVRAYDGSEYTDYKTFTFTVIPVDDRPTVDEVIVTVDVGGSVTFKVYGYDADEPAAGEWRFDYVDTGDLHGTLTPGAALDEGNGVYSMEFTFVPDADYEGRDSFDFTFYTDGPGTLTDGAGTDIGSSGSGYTRYVELADVDGDGDLDLVTGTKGGVNNGNKVYYYDQALEQFVDSGLGFGTNDTRWMQVIDINGDDLPDVVEANDSGNEVRFYINQGGGTDAGWGGFVYGGDVGSDSLYDYDVAVGDINHDGWLDVVASGQSESRYYLSNGTDAGGNLSFAEGVTIGNLGSYPDTYEVLLKDVNNDGWLDVIEANTGANTVYLNNQTGAGPGGWFDQTGIDFGGGATRSIDMADLNGDGYLDIVAGQGTESDYEVNKVYYNLGVAGTWSGFDSGTDIGTDEQNTYSIRLGDVNGDGQLDVITGNRGNADNASGGEVTRVYFNDGSGSFPGAEYTGEGTPWGSDTNPTYSLTVGDVNGDTWLDLVTGNRGTTEKLYLNEAYEYSDSAKVFIIDTLYDAPIAYPEVVWMSYSEDSLTFKVTGYDPDFHLASEISFDVYGSGAQYEDSLTKVGSVQYEGNGIYSQTFTYDPLDDFWGTDSFQFTISTPSGGWYGFAPGEGEAIGAAADSYNTFDMGLIDLNEDGKPDVLVTANGGDVGDEPNMFYTIDADGNFSNGQAVDAAGEERGSLYLAVGDLNKDGYEDFVVHNSEANDVYYLWNPSLNRFDSGIELLNSASGDDGAVAIGDINSDGNLDIVVGLSDAPDRIYLNAGNGTFDAGTQMIVDESNRSTRAIAVADFDNDGYDDVAVAKWNWYTVIYWNNQSGGFDYYDTYEIRTTGYANYMDVGDVDGDGDIDIVVGNEWGGNNNRSSNNYYSNDGDGTFTRTRIYSRVERDDTGNIRLADVNGDGYLDAVVTNDGDPNKYYLFNPGSNRFNLAGVTIGNLYALGNASYGGIVGDVDGDGDMDYITGMLGDQNRYFDNLGYDTGGSHDIYSEPAEVTIHRGLLENWSFENGFEGWSFDERTIDIDSEEFTTFGIVENGTTIDNTMTVWDYKDEKFQIQYWTYLGPLITYDSITIQDNLGDDGENVAVLLSSLGPQKGIIYQDIIIPEDGSVNDLYLEWRMAYWNLGTNGTTPSFNDDTSTEQYIAIYVYDPTGPMGDPIWITTNDTSAQVSELMQEYRVQIPSSVYDGSEGKQVRVAIEMVSKYDFMEMAIDDFQIVPIRGGVPSSGPDITPGIPVAPYEGEPQSLELPGAGATAAAPTVTVTASTTGASGADATPSVVGVSMSTMSTSTVTTPDETGSVGSTGSETSSGSGTLSLLSVLEANSAQNSVLLDTLETQAADSTSGETDQAITTETTQTPESQSDESAQTSDAVQTQTETQQTTATTDQQSDGTETQTQSTNQQAESADTATEQEDQAGQDQQTPADQQPATTETPSTDPQDDQSQQAASLLDLSTTLVFDHNDGNAFQVLSMQSGDTTSVREDSPLDAIGAKLSLGDSVAFSQGSVNLTELLA